MYYNHAYYPSATSVMRYFSCFQAGTAVVMANTAVQLSTLQEVSGLRILHADDEGLDFVQKGSNPLQDHVVLSLPAEIGTSLSLYIYI